MSSTRSRNDPVVAEPASMAEKWASSLGNRSGGAAFAGGTASSSCQLFVRVASHVAAATNPFDAAQHPGELLGIHEQSLQRVVNLRLFGGNVGNGGGLPASGTLKTDWPQTGRP